MCVQKLLPSKRDLFKPFDNGRQIIDMQFWQVMMDRLKAHHANQGKSIMAVYISYSPAKKSKTLKCVKAFCEDISIGFQRMKNCVTNLHSF